MSKPRLYLETTIPSYLTAWPSRDQSIAEKQEITKEWWRDRKSEFELFISEIVYLECAAGDSAAAKERLEVIEGIPWLDNLDEVTELAEAIMASGALPEKAATDAAHIAMSAVHEIEFLMTWNCSHIANGQIIKVIRRVCAAHGYDCPEVRTPTGLMGIQS